MHVQHAIQIQIVGMQIDGRAGRFVHAAQSDDVIDVRVRHHDGRDLQMMPLDHFQDSRRIVARIDDDRFAGLRIADDVAIALQHADRKNFVNQFLSFLHTAQYNIGIACRTATAGCPRNLAGLQGQPGVAVLPRAQIFILL